MWIINSNEWEWKGERQQGQDWDLALSHLPEPPLFLHVSFTCRLQDGTVRQGKGPQRKMMARARKTDGGFHFPSRCSETGKSLKGRLSNFLYKSLYFFHWWSFGFWSFASSDRVLTVLKTYLILQTTLITRGPFSHLLKYLYSVCVLFDILNKNISFLAY